MELGTDFVTAGKRISDNDFRSSVRLPVEEDGSVSDGWTWVAALLIAALFIVSGYLDQESNNSQQARAGVSQNYAQGPSSGSASVSGAGDYQAEKGY
jgi:hypothetical protein